MHNAIYCQLVIAIISIAISLGYSPAGSTLERPDMEFKVFQFPKSHIPVIDGHTSDWDMVGEEYTYGTEYLDGTKGGHGAVIDTTDIDVSVRVGWVNGLNRLYLLYEAYDDYWDFDWYEDNRGYRNDIFEIVVDADRSGGPIIHNPQIEDRIENHFRFSGVHAQNYHIFTPPINNQWCMVWGSNPWIGGFPWSHYAYNYAFSPGESGRLVLEFWITPFDYAPHEGPDRAVVSGLKENELIGLSWAILDFDHGRKDGENNINLAHDTNMVKDASALCAFRLMPLDPEFLPDIAARWSFKVIDPSRRLVYFKDESVGVVDSWTWRFGDGSISHERNPIHHYEKAGIRYNVMLEITGQAGTSAHSKHWEVSVP